MLIICWTESSTGEPCWEARDGSAETTIAAWTSSHPGEKISYAFRPDDDLIAGKDKQKTLFLQRAADYGLSPADYNAPFYLAGRRKAVIKGIQPGRKKYVVLVWDCTAQSYILATPGTVRWGLEEYRKIHGPYASTPANPAMEKDVTIDARQAENAKNLFLGRGGTPLEVTARFANGLQMVIRCEPAGANIPSRAEAVLLDANGFSTGQVVYSSYFVGPWEIEHENVTYRANVVIR